MGQLQSIDYYLESVDSNPEILALESDAGISEKELKLLRMKKYPGFSLGYSHDFEDGSHFNGVTLGISLPVYSRKHSYDAASDRNRAAVLNTESRKVEIQAEINRLYDEASGALETMRDLGPLVESVNNLALLQKALDGGEMSLLNYLQEVNYFLQARIDYLQFAKTYHLSLLQLNSMR